MICQFNHQPCQYVECPLWAEELQKCLFQMAVNKALGRPELTPETWPLLSATDRDILVMMACGCRNGHIGQVLGISTKTVSKRVSGLLQILGARSRAHAVAIAYKQHILRFQETLAEKVPA